MGTNWTVTESGKLTLADDIELSASKKVSTDFIKSTTAGTDGHIVPAVADDTLTLLNATQTLNNKTLESPIINNGTFTGSSISGTISDSFNINSDGNGIILDTTGLSTTRTVTFPDEASQVLVGNSATQTLSNKTLDNSSTITIKSVNFTLQDNSDTSKQARFGVSGISTATTRMFVFPDADTTLVGTDTTQTLSNKTLTTPTISSFINANHNHQNAAGGGQLDITLATTGTLGINRGGTNATSFSANEIIRMNAGGTALESTGKVVPSGTIVGTTDSQTLTNKIITGTTNDVSANRLRGATEVEIDSTSTPINGQTLVFNNGTGKAEWNTVAGGTGHDIEFNGVSVPTETNLNFKGSGVLVTDNPGAGSTDVEIPISNDITVDDELVLSDENGFDQVVTLDFVGAVQTVPVEDYFVATGGQTVFTLSTTPTPSTIFFAFINGLARAASPNNDSTRDYNLSGTTLTFTFGLTVGDIVLIKYLS